MAYNGAILSRAREAISRRHEENLAEQARRTERVYARIPRIKEIDAALRRQMASLCALTFSRETGAHSKIDAIREDNLRLQAERAALLRAAGYGEDYLDEIYDCRRCHDTGYDGIEMCECLKREYKSELTRELSGLLRDGGETFADFRLDYYSAETDPALGASPREVMSIVFETCRAYAANFSSGSPSLIFRGGPGLGKTFLSACIAREVSDHGFSVVYDTAAHIFQQFESGKFGRENPYEEDPDREIDRYLKCDLLIMDDLGTEMLTSFVQSAFYRIVNDRLISRRKTVLSTNLTVPELGRRYGLAVQSRLEGEYRVLQFFGRDIRRLKRDR